MSRLVWVGIGAVGGIYAYRKGQRAMAEVRVRGVAGTATLAAHTAVQWYGQVRSTTQEIQQREQAKAGSAIEAPPGELVDLTPTARTRRRKGTAAHPRTPEQAVTMAEWTPLRSGRGS